MGAHYEVLGRTPMVYMEIPNTVNADECAILGCPTVAFAHLLHDIIVCTASRSVPCGLRAERVKTHEQWTHLTSQTDS
jgi:hypothetical protein